MESRVPVAEVGRQSAGRRRLIDGIRRRERTGASWRDSPVEYGPWHTVHGSRRWQRTGVRRAVPTGPQMDADADTDADTEATGLTTPRKTGQGLDP
ncbi:transposase [Streptomyces cyaneochromogenes]|uniref:transposase n=1 Tax=Streptomyces cyaneochromogenes TaxID=2496836 RepID=UPI001E3A1510|nr:transposase [Streptomyces cyaneochromogenes]